MRHILKHKLLVAFFSLSLILVVGGGLWAWGALRHISQPLILHFNDKVGINQTGTVFDLLKVSAVGLVATLVNTLISAALVEREKFFSFFVAGGTLLINILIFIGFAAIISVN
jgi:hypothetical protein